VKAAFAVWRGRVNAREEDTALFFFSGHGVERNQWQGLLLEGFDATKADPFEDVINLLGFKAGMDGCLARKQCFLVDACRSTPPELANLDMRSDPGVRLIAAQYDLPTDVVRDVAFIRAAGARQVAWGVADQPSRFTGALLRALRGAGCSRLDDRWEVRTDTLVCHLNTLLKYESEAHKLAVQNVRGPGDDSGGFVLHVPARPLVPVVVACVPDSDTARARFEIKRGGESVCKRDALAGNWELELVLDEYDVFAIVDGPPRQKRILAHPTICAVRL
jgi:hypothetical protein